MDTMTVDLKLSPDQIEQLDEVARSRQLILAEAVQLAVIEWLDQEWRLYQARQKMRMLGQGLGKGQAQDVSQNHDAYLYKRAEA
jgi:hypothetical protein